ncbi:MAG: hypothetical protein EA353_09885, partial [Puniceicoccaceae bacterium]
MIAGTLDFVYVHTPKSLPLMRAYPLLHLFSRLRQPVSILIVVASTIAYQLGGQTVRDFSSADMRFDWSHKSAELRGTRGAQNVFLHPGGTVGYSRLSGLDLSGAVKIRLVLQVLPENTASRFRFLLKDESVPGTAQIQFDIAVSEIESGGVAVLEIPVFEGESRISESPYDLIPPRWQHIDAVEVFLPEELSSGSYLALRWHRIEGVDESGEIASAAPPTRQVPRPVVEAVKPTPPARPMRAPELLPSFERLVIDESDVVWTVAVGDTAEASKAAAHVETLTEALRWAQPRLER